MAAPLARLPLAWKEPVSPPACARGRGWACLPHPDWLTPNPSRKREGDLPRGVVGELVLGQLEADQQLEARAGERLAHVGLGERVDRRLGLAGAAAGGNALADL